MAVGTEKSKILIKTLSPAVLGGGPQQVKLVPVIRIKDGEVYISLKIGNQRLYAVKDFAEFFSLAAGQEIVKYGKSFVFNPAKAEYSPEITGFINLMNIILDKNAPHGREYLLEERFVLPVIQQLAGAETEIFCETVGKKGSFIGNQRINGEPRRTPSPGTPERPSHRRRPLRR